MISSEKCFFFSTPGRNLCSCHSKETVFNDFMVDFSSILNLIKVRMYHLSDTVFTEYRLCNELRVLQIHLILFIIAVIGKFRVACNIQVSFPIGTICKKQPPHLIGLFQWNIIAYFRTYFPVIRQHFRICGSMTALTLI